MSLADDRRRYEGSVRALRLEANEMLSAGRTEEEVAVAMVARRNGLKAKFRDGVDPLILAQIESRNRARYGDSVGPTALQLRQRYGSWMAVIDAACRPADLSVGHSGIIPRP